jgi:hypothetical protein
MQCRDRWNIGFFMGTTPPMRGVQIRDLQESRRVLAVDLRHILDLLDDRAIRSQWRVSGVWALSNAEGWAAEELEKLADGKTFITGEHLNRIAHCLSQVIDGEFSAFANSSESPWLIIRAIDSSFYEVFSTEPDVLDGVRASFQEVSDCDFVA